MSTTVVPSETATYSRWVRRMAKDPRLFATHISLYTALFICWQKHGFSQPFHICRRELMVFSKIASIATYQKCIKELNNYGYIRYVPSYHPKLGSQVYWPAASGDI